MPTIKILIGQPYSGKSTYTALYSEWVVVSFDEQLHALAKEMGLTYEQFFETGGNTQLAAEKTEQAYRKALQYGADIIVDCTNLTRSSRAQKLRGIPDGYSVEAHIFPMVSRKDWEKRSKMRLAQPVPYKVCQTMQRMYEPPSLSEGFNLIVTHGFEELYKA